MGHDEMLQVLKEKMRLEGQLESLSSEANQVIKHSNFCHTHPLKVVDTITAQISQYKAITC